MREYVCAMSWYIALVEQCEQNLTQCERTTFKLCFSHVGARSHLPTTHCQQNFDIVTKLSIISENELEWGCIEYITSVTLFAHNDRKKNIVCRQSANGHRGGTSVFASTIQNGFFDNKWWCSHLMLVFSRIGQQGSKKTQTNGTCEPTFRLHDGFQTDNIKFKIQLEWGPALCPHLRVIYFASFLCVKANLGGMLVV